MYNPNGRVEFYFGSWLYLLAGILALGDGAPEGGLGREDRHLEDDKEHDAGGEREERMSQHEIDHDEGEREEEVLLLTTLIETRKRRRKVRNLPDQKIYCRRRSNTTESPKTAVLATRFYWIRAFFNQWAFPSSAPFILFSIFD